MSTVEKVSVSLGAEEIAWARKHAEATGQSLSAVLTDAVGRKRQSVARQRLLEELGTDDITNADLDAVRAEWQVKPARGVASVKSARDSGKERKATAKVGRRGR